MRPWRWLLGLTLVAFARVASAQLQLAEVRGLVREPQGEPAPAATVRLLDTQGRVVFVTASDGQGRFALRGVAPGSYLVEAESALGRAPKRPLAVGSALALELELRIATSRAEEVVVTAAADAPALSTGTAMAGESVGRAPTTLGSRGLQAALATTPGFSTEDNGLLHVRGVDDGFLFVKDGIPIYERIDPAFGVSPEAVTISSLNVITGHIPAEFGLKSGAVVEVRSLSGLERPWSGMLEGALGGDRRGSLSALASGRLGHTASLMMNANGERSDRFLDPVDPGNFHNHGAVGSAEARLSWNPSAVDLLTVGLNRGRSRFEVPHLEEQEAAGQDQRQDIAQTFVLASWQRSWSSRTVSQLSLHGRLTEADLDPSERDTPVFAQADRHQDRFGLLGSVTQQRGHHVLKAGFELSRIALRESFGFHVTDVEAAAEAGFGQSALAFTSDNPFAFQGRLTSTQVALHAQDTWRLVTHLLVNLGLRYDQTALPTRESQWSPRVAAAYDFAGRRTTIRASADRFFQPPQAENLLLSSSEEARALSPFVEETGGGSLLRAERQTALELGVNQWIAGLLRLDVALWKRDVRHFADPNVFLGTTIIFPNSVDRGQAHGFDLRLDLPRRGSFSGYLGYTYAKVVQYGPIDGGLFLEDDVIEIGPGTQFTPDHDQRHVAAWGLSYEAAGFSAFLSGRYESGTPLEVGDETLDELRSRPGAERVDFDAERVKPRVLFNLTVGKRVVRAGRFDLRAELAVLNLTDAAYAFNFGNPFSGTHFGPPRTLAAKIRVEIR